MYRGKQGYSQVHVFLALMKNSVVLLSTRIVLFKKTQQSLRQQGPCSNCNANSRNRTSDIKPKATASKKELSIKQYGIKRKYKPTHKFKCSLCPSELPTVQEFNQHFIDNHPPLPCPDCTRVLTLPRTLAKHQYTHAEYMYECQACGQGFIFKSQLESHQRVHLKLVGYVCFKPKCGRRFKRESELNAHLITHDKKEIKCGYENCDYSNLDIHNMRAHHRKHSDKLPFHCLLCLQGL